MPDITDWSIEEIETWEVAHQQFATDERADAAAERWDREHAHEIEESRFWARHYEAEAEAEAEESDD